MSVGEQRIRIGIDLGGTKIEGVALGGGRSRVGRHRMPAPRDDYAASVEAIPRLRRLDRTREPRHGRHRHAGLAVAGDRPRAQRQLDLAQRPPLQRDIEARLGRSVRFANDANCFALSEAVDGAGAGARLVFGVILGTGCGGGIVHGGRCWMGRSASAANGVTIPCPGRSGRASGAPVLVRTPRLHGNVGVGPGARGGSSRVTGER